MYFPMVFSLKIVTATVHDDIEGLIISVLQHNKVDESLLRLSSRLSRAGNYVSFTATFMAKSQEQLDNIYRALSSNPKIIMVL